MESDERLTYVDDGMDEVVIKYRDIPDFIVDYNDKFGQTDLKFYDYESSDMTPIITTFGSFLNSCDPEVRKDIIDRLVHLQQGGKIKKYKVINENDLEEVRMELDFKNIKI